jgi:hypothetical protein
MNLNGRVEKLESALRVRVRVAVEDLTDEQKQEMARQTGYDMTALTDAELRALRDCYTDDGDYLEERMTPDLSAALERVRCKLASQSP